MSNVLITGVAGLLGSRMAEWILDNTEYSVIGIDNLQGGYLENIDSFFKFSSFYYIIPKILLFFNLTFWHRNNMLIM